jgi:tetratricopeptide (TPR) repeat protein
MAESVVAARTPQNPLDGRAPAATAPGHIALALLALILLAVLTYSNSFQGPFVLDDIPAILTNAHIRHLWPPSLALTAPHETTVAGRPIVCLTLALNYALSGLDVWSYHALNLAIHIAAGCVLFGVLRRTFLTAPLCDRFGRDALPLALAIAAIWIVHPLNTMCVSYIIQRTEALMSLCYLLALYCVIRSDDSPRPALWQAAAVLACLAGMGSKEVAASLPIVTLIYDATFLAGSYREALRHRGWMYVALAACWIPLAMLITAGPRNESTGTEISGLTPWDYLKTQPEVIVHYLRLVVWPAPLCLDYGWTVATGWSEILVPGCILLAALAATVWGAARRRPWAFLGICFFAILAPSSSVVPIVIIASEHRMYLPSIAVIAGVVLLLWNAASHLAPSRAALARQMLAVAALSVVLLFAALTINRNTDYQSPLDLWKQVTEVRPDNPRAWTSVGALLGEAGHSDEAAPALKKAIALSPDYADAHLAYGAVLAHDGLLGEAIDELDATLRLRPDDKKAECTLGAVLAKEGRYPEAITHLKVALDSAPDFAAARGQLGIVLKLEGQNRAAVDELRAAVALQSDLADELNALAWILATDSDPSLHNPPEAIAAAERACALTNNANPQFLDTLAATYAAADRFSEAVSTAQQALAATQKLHLADLALLIRARLELYRQHKPFYEPPAPQSPPTINPNAN